MVSPSQEKLNPLSTSGNTPDCIAWRTRLIARHPSLEKFWAWKHKQIAKSEGFVKANQWLGEQERLLKIGQSGLFCDSSYQEICDYADAKSKKIQAQTIESVHTIGTQTQSDKNRICEFIRTIVNKAGITFPLTEGDYSNDELKSAIGRACDHRWWRSQLRSTAARQYENYVRSCGLIGLDKQIYCSDFTLYRRTEQKRRNRRLLEQLEAVNSKGETFTLAELSDLSVSNPIIRRTELMTRIGGDERYAKNNLCPDSNNKLTIKYVSVFNTITAPSKYHPRITRERRDGTKYTIPNPKYNGSTVKQANDYICTVWSKIRAEWKRRGIKPFGFRMVEPHHDGTPHWHMVLFLPENRLIEASYIFHSYALEEDADEYGAEEYRSQVKYIDPSQGSAAGYCAKYISKSIDGFGIDADLYGKDAVTSALKIEAWATTHGIRQFQQIGGPSVTVYREARRIKSNELEVTIDSTAMPIIEAADAGDWEKYTELMGGPECALKDRPIRPCMIPREEANRYNEFTSILIGLLIANKPLKTRIESWAIRPIKHAHSETKATSWSSSLNGYYPSPKAA